MRVALIYPQYQYIEDQTPLGIGYLAAKLKRDTDSQVEVFDTLFHGTPENTITLVKNKKFDLIGFSVMTPMLKSALYLAGYFKGRNAQTRIIFGGAHPTVAPDETLQNKEVDAVAIGEGENTLTELIKNNLNFSQTIP